MKQGWEIKKLGEVSEILNGGTPKTSIAEYWDGDIHWITPADLGKLKKPTVDDTPRKITRLGLEKSSAKLFPENSIILSTRAPIGHLAINEVPMSTNQGCRGIVPNKKLETWYLYYFLKKNVELLDTLGTGATFKELSTKALAGVEIPLPPLPEQQRIVSILDEAFAAIAKAKANAEQNLKNAKELFESYLQEVFENKGDNWAEKTLKEVCAKITDGTHQTPKYFDDGIIFLSSKNVTSGKIDWENIKYIDEKQHIEMHKRVAPRIGDILLAKNGTTGVAAMVDRDVVFDIYVSLAHIRVLDEIIPDFMLYFINSPIAKKQFNKRLKGSGVPNLHLEEIREVIIPFPKSKETQQTIVRQLEALRAETQKLEAVYQKKIDDLEELKKSILQKAFAGELTSSDSVSASVAKVIPLQKVNGISATDLQAGITALALQKHIEKNQQHTFHHVKAEKIVHLSEYILNIDLERNPVKDAAGPNDFTHAKKVESRARKAGFYSVYKNGEYYDYQQGKNINSVIQKTKNSLGEKADTLSQVIDMLIPMTTQQAEIVATVYAAWNNLLLNGVEFTNEDVVTEARENWHKEKVKISRDKFFNAIEWMQKNELLIPKGSGKSVKMKIK